jgi:hypothetical protein
VEIIEDGGQTRDGLVHIAFAQTREEAAIMRGLLREADIRSLAKQGPLDGPGLGTGTLSTSSRHIYVRAEDADAARELLANTMVEDPLEAEFPESVNAEYLADATGHKPRDYSTFGAFARFYIIAAILIGAALGIFLLLH